ncbi:unnamed protein product [Euphydryas editha]|uniref:BEN domain-containing protein n=1 Tax=Euphydryas editha TaxID=104508 RepID=A0AAU9UBB4_EUPED|nr:unnamed protein product [Euphydryas editha]
MIRRMDHSRRAFYVVQFLELPFEGIDDYVCVPNPWVKVRKATKNKSVVAYPQDENPFVTRDRVKNEERCNDAWRYYMASIKYEKDSFEDAEYWIATSNYNALSIEGELKTTGIEPEFSLNKQLRIANRNHSSKLNDNPRKPLPRIISTKPKNNQQTPTLQVTKETLSPILTKVLNSVRQALSATDNQYLQNEQQFQGNHSERALVNENHLSEIDNTLETDEWMKEETPSAHHGANSDSDTVIDHEVTSDHEMSADEAPIEITNNFYGHEITSGSSSADRPIAAQNSTNHQTHSRVVLMQQMLDNFDTLFIQMGSTYRDTTDMYNTLRSLMLDTAQTYKKLIGLVELMPQSGVYVSYGDLKYSQQVSKDCKSLAKRLLSEIFNRNALSVCLSMTERAQAPDNIGYNIRPELDVNACTVLLNFVVEHGLQRGWNTDLQPILSTLHSKIKEIRFKYGVVVQC